MRNQKRVQMRVRETLKYWNLMMVNFSQVVMEGGVECEAMEKKVLAMGDNIRDALQKAYDYGVVKGGKR